jgi:hypothetical protein
MAIWGSRFVCDIVNFMIFAHCDEEAATAFFKQAINANGCLKK